MYWWNYLESFCVFKKGRRKTVEITQEPCWLWCTWDEGHTFSVYPERPLREVFGEFCPGACAPGFCLFQCCQWLCSQWSLKTIRLLSSSKEPPAQFELKMPLLDIYNPTVKLCLVFPQWLFEVSKFAWCQLHTQMYLHCFLSLCQSGCGRSVNPTIFSTQMPCLLPAASLSIFNSLEFNVFFYRAGKGPLRSLGHEKEDFAFLTKWNQQ